MFLYLPSPERPKTFALKMSLWKSEYVWVGTSAAGD